MSASKAHSGIDDTNRAFEEAFSESDAAAAAAVYTDDGQILPPNGALTTGRSAIQAFWQVVMDMGIAKVQLRTLELEVHGDTAWEVGEGDLLTADGAVADTAKYIVIWKRENGEWRWHRDIWNSNNPA